VVIFNNASYRILKQRTLALKGFSAEDDKYVPWTREPAPRLRRPRQSPGRAGRARGEVADVGPAIHRGLASGGPYVIDVRIDGSFKASAWRRP